MEPVYRTIITGVVAMFRTLRWRVIVRGLEHVPETGPAVIATNHVGYLDFTFVGYAVRPAGRVVRFMAKQEVFDHRISGPLMRAMKHIPVDRYGTPRQALDATIAALAQGNLVGMFPEGTINVSFVPGRGKSGAARIAMEAGVPLIPGVVWGSQRIMTKGRKNNFQRGVPITVSFGEPIAYDPDDAPSAVHDRLMERISSMMTEAARTYPDSPRGVDDRWWLPAHLGGTAPTVAEASAMAADQAAARRAKRRADRADNSSSQAT